MWSGLTGKGSPFEKILKLLGKIIDAIDDMFTGNRECCQEIKASLARIEAGDTPWQKEVSDTLARIEEAVSGGEAVTLVVEVGEEYKQ